MNVYHIMKGKCKPTADSGHTLECVTWNLKDMREEWSSFGLSNGEGSQKGGVLHTLSQIASRLCTLPVLALPPAIPTFFPFKDSDFFLLLKYSCYAIMYITGVQYGDSQFLKVNMTLFLMLCRVSLWLILSIILCTSYFPTIILSLPTSLSPVVTTLLLYIWVCFFFVMFLCLLYF